jgi:hypothetical protein
METIVISSESEPEEQNEPIKREKATESGEASLSISEEDDEEEEVEEIVAEDRIPPTDVLLSRAGRWVKRECLTDEDLSWNRCMRLSGAIYDAVRYKRKPVLFHVESHSQLSQCCHYAWWPPADEEPLAVDVLKTMLVTRLSPRYRVKSNPNHAAADDDDDGLQRHRALINAFIQVLCSPPDTPELVDTEYANSVALLRFYFETVELGQLRQVYFYDDEPHIDGAVYAEDLDYNLPVFHWSC